MQPEPKSILNPSKRAKFVKFDNTNKDGYADNFRTARLRSNHDQSIQVTGKTKNSNDYLSAKQHHLSFGLKSVNNDNKHDNAGYRSENMTRSVGSRIDQRNI